MLITAAGSKLHYVFLFYTSPSNGFNLLFVSFFFFGGGATASATTSHNDSCAACVPVASGRVAPSRRIHLISTAPLSSTPVHFIVGVRQTIGARRATQIGTNVYVKRCAKVQRRARRQTQVAPSIPKPLLQGRAGVAGVQLRTMMSLRTCAQSAWTTRRMRLWTGRAVGSVLLAGR